MHRARPLRALILCLLLTACGDDAVLLGQTVEDHLAVRVTLDGTERMCLVDSGADAVYVPDDAEDGHAWLALDQGHVRVRAVPIDASLFDLSNETFVFDRPVDCLLGMSALRAPRFAAATIDYDAAAVVLHPRVPEHTLDEVVPLDLSTTWPMATLEVGDQSLLMILDTGASIITMREQVFEDANPRGNTLAALATPTGTEYARQGTIFDLTLGAWRFDQAEAVGIELPAVLSIAELTGLPLQGLVGANLLASSPVLLFDWRSGTLFAE